MADVETATRRLALTLDVEAGRDVAAVLARAGQTADAEALSARIDRDGETTLAIPRPALAVLARTLHMAGRATTARFFYEALLHDDETDHETRHYLGVLHHSEGRTGLALEALARAQEGLAGQASAWNNYGNVLKEAGRPDEAAAAYDRALALAPGFLQAMNNRAIVHRMKKERAEAEALLLKVIEAAPDFAAAHNNLGNLYVELGRMQDAERAYVKAILLLPNLAQPKIDLAYCHQVTGEIDKAAAIYEEMLAENPDNAEARHMLAALGRDTPPERAPDDYVAAVFDAFASGFEASLAHLKYRAPQLIEQELEKRLGAARLDRVLDAGCGTGLCADFLKARAGTLVGVDLSTGMLAKAKARGLYDALEAAELTAWLGAVTEPFDLIVSADTLCYFGALEAFAAAAHGALVPGGRLVFTVEALKADDPAPFRILTSGRYAHARAYVEATLAGAGLTVEGVAPAHLRLERAIPVEGFLVTALRPAQAPAAADPA